MGGHINKWPGNKNANNSRLREKSQIKKSLKRKKKKTHIHTHKLIYNLYRDFELKNINEINDLIIDSLQNIRMKEDPVAILNHLHSVDILLYILPKFTQFMTHFNGKKKNK